MSQKSPGDWPDKKGLRFTPYAWQKYMFMLHAGDTEVGLWGLTSPEDKLLVHDVVLTKQKCTAAHVEFDMADFAEYIDRMDQQGVPADCCGRIWLHTHPGASPEPSTTDWNTLNEDFASYKWIVMGIVSRTQMSYALLRVDLAVDIAGVKKYDQKLEMQVDWRYVGTQKPDSEAWKAEYEAKVEKQGWNNQGTGYGYQYDTRPYYQRQIGYQDSQQTSSYRGYPRTPYDHETKIVGGRYASQAAKYDEFNRKKLEDAGVLRKKSISANDVNTEDIAEVRIYACRKWGVYNIQVWCNAWWGIWDQMWMEIEAGEYQPVNKLKGYAEFNEKRHGKSANKTTQETVKKTATGEPVFGDSSDGEPVHVHIRNKVKGKVKSKEPVVVKDGHGCTVTNSLDKGIEAKGLVREAEVEEIEKREVRRYCGKKHSVITPTVFSDLWWGFYVMLWEEIEAGTYEPEYLFNNHNGPSGPPGPILGLIKKHVESKKPDGIDVFGDPNEGEVEELTMEELVGDGDNGMWDGMAIDIHTGQLIDEFNPNQPFVD